MARQLRIQYAGAIYHLMSSGDRREEIFRDDLDRKSLLQALGAACEKPAGRCTPIDERFQPSSSGKDLPCATSEG